MQPDHLIIARGRLLAKYGSLWKAAASYSSGFSANWLGRRLKGLAPIDADLANWLATQTGMNPQAFTERRQPDPEMLPDLTDLT